MQRYLRILLRKNEAHRTNQKHSYLKFCTILNVSLITLLYKQFDHMLNESRNANIPLFIPTTISPPPAKEA